MINIYLTHENKVMSLFTTEPLYVHGKMLKQVKSTQTTGCVLMWTSFYGYNHTYCMELEFDSDSECTTTPIRNYHYDAIWTPI
jgi:hypothetical protein